MTMQTAIKGTVSAIVFSAIAITGSAFATTSTAHAATSAASGTIVSAPSSYAHVKCYSGQMQAFTTASPEPGYGIQSFGTKYNLWRWNGSQWIWQRSMLANAPGTAGIGMWTYGDFTISTRGYYAVSTEIVWFRLNGTTNYANRWANQYQYPVYSIAGNLWDWKVAPTSYCQY